jgi:hypothetical protein
LVLSSGTAPQVSIEYFLVANCSLIVQLEATQAVMSAFSLAVVHMHVMLVREHSDCNVNSVMHNNYSNEHVNLQSDVVSYLTPHFGGSEVAGAAESAAAATKLTLQQKDKRTATATVRSFMATKSDVEFKLQRKDERDITWQTCYEWENGMR